MKYLLSQWRSGFLGYVCNISTFNDLELNVFPNLCIEHVVDFNREKIIAKDFKRVGEKIWIKTPNNHFPI